VTGAADRPAVLPPHSTSAAIILAGLTAGYGRSTILHGIDLEVASASLTAVIGPNGCGKTTLVRVMAGLLRPTEGTVLLEGIAIDRLRRREVARKVALLAQINETPLGLDVISLVARSRYPYTTLWRQWSPADDAAVSGALARVGATDLAARSVAELSGGQMQRVWLASLLAQQTGILLLDEPTTFLDVAAQQTTYGILADLARDGASVLVTVHDLNQARLADHVVVMKQGRVVGQGPAALVMNAHLLSEVYETELRAVEDPLSGVPLIVDAWPGGRVEA
jgi:iron complex transport system ATP-binding protein